MEGTIAQILFFAGNFAPRNWAFCNGQLLSISSNTALFSLLGTFYGGNGQTTFALPNFQSRVPVGTGQGPGLADISLGEMAGSTTVTLLINQMPVHSHTAPATIAVSGSNADNESPVGNIFTASNSDSYGTSANGSASGGIITTNMTGGEQPFSTMQPTLGINFLICMFGSFPARN